MQFIGIRCKKIKRIHRRVDDRMLEVEKTMDGAKAKGFVGGVVGDIFKAKVNAAEWLDVNERKDKTLNEYESKFLASLDNFDGKKEAKRRKTTK
jgi:hypothetical protein